MIISTIMAGSGLHHAGIKLWTTHSYPTASIHVYGAHIRVGPGVLTMSNGDFEVVLDTADAGEPARSRGDDQSGGIMFSATVLATHKKFEALKPGHRVDVVLTPLEHINQAAATQAVMHTPRTLHGPGPYPEHTRWGAWINGYRADAAARAAATRASRAANG